MLMRSMERKRAGEGGFTLIELLVVIAILGILAGIVVFAVAGINDKGQQNADKTTCSVLQTAEEAFFAKTGGYAVDGAKTAQTQLKEAGFLRTVNPAFTIVTPASGSTDVGYTISGPNCS
jgi:prepilin-type N-terminal cleavage/methylation domain-containing protein